MDRNLYDAIEDIANVWYCEIVASDAPEDIINILEGRLVIELDVILKEIKDYKKMIEGKY